MFRHRHQSILGRVRTRARAITLPLAAIPVIVILWGWVRSYSQWDVLERCSQVVIFPDGSRRRMEADEIWDLHNHPEQINFLKDFHAQITKIRLESACGAILLRVEGVQHESGRNFWERYREPGWPKVGLPGIGYNGSRWDSSAIRGPLGMRASSGHLPYWWEQPLPTMGARYANWSYSGLFNGSTTRRQELVVTYWSLLLAWAMPWSLWLALHRARARWTARRRKLGLCLKCGYDLRASKDRCPECGSAIPPVPEKSGQ